MQKSKSILRNNLYPILTNSLMEEASKEVNRVDKQKELEMGKKFVLIVLAGSWVMFLSGAAIGQHGHDHGTPSPASPKGGSQQMQMGSQPVQSTTVEGLKITFEVMDMSAHMAMPGMKGMSMPGMKGNPQQSGSEQSKSHVIMVTVQDPASREIISDAKVTYTILSPSGGKEPGKLEWAGDYFGGGFSPKEKGSYQVQLMIESGGMEREAKFTYEFK